MNSLSFSKPNLLNLEPIEWPLSSVFTNKYCKIWCWPRNYIYLREFTNSSIPVFHRNAPIHLYSVNFEYLLVYRYSDNEYQWIAIPLLSTILTMQLAIRWAIMKVIFNYSRLPSPHRQWQWKKIYKLDNWSKKKKKKRKKRKTRHVISMTGLNKGWFRLTRMASNVF